MASETLNKIKRLIESSKSFGILLDQNPEEHEFLAKEILEHVITDKNLPSITLPEDLDEHKNKWKPILKEKIKTYIPQKSSIKLPKDKYKIKELSYEEDDDYLSLILTPQNGNLLKEDVLIENTPPETDLLFCLFERESKLDLYKEKIKIPEREKIIFINPCEKTLTEKIFTVAEIFNPNLLTDKNLTTLLHAALLKETENLKESSTKETLSLASLFLENGAETEIINNVLNKEKSTSITQIIGRVLARTYIDEVPKISWSFLNQRDLQKTNQSANTTSSTFFFNLLKKIRNILPPLKLHILLWQSAGGVNALITGPFSKNESYILPLASKLKAKTQSRFFVAGPFENFSQAESILKKQLKEEIINNQHYQLSKLTN